MGLVVERERQRIGKRRQDGLGVECRGSDWLAVAVIEEELGGR